MIGFHRLLIATAIFFCAGIGLWMVSAYRGNGSVAMLVLGISFGIAALALSYYLRNLERFLKR